MVAMVRLNRPQQRNALSPEVLGEVAQVFELFDVDAAIRCLVLTGGADVLLLVQMFRRWLSERRWVCLRGGVFVCGSGFVFVGSRLLRR